MVGQFEYTLMPLRSSADSRTFSPLYGTPTWSRICTTWPENPHCGNCGVPFMNSTTSLPLTSLSIHCSMLISRPFAKLFWPRPRGQPPVPHIYVAHERPAAQGPCRLFVGARSDKRITRFQERSCSNNEVERDGFLRIVIALGAHRRSPRPPKCRPD